MSNSHVVLNNILQQLPENWHAAVVELANATLKTESPLRLILVGLFSVGKSSLINMLIEENLLQTALEETTALPTFIEYGNRREIQLVGSDGSILPLDEGICSGDHGSPRRGGLCYADSAFIVAARDFYY